MVPVLGFTSLSRNGSTSLVMEGTQGWKAWDTPVARDTCYFCRALWDSNGGRSGGNLGMASRVRQHLAAPVCPHSS